ncbi:MAG: copper resistance protein B [Gammaproteobacteria bacterium]|nr:copper resistance protein B [Gammaproteobacteria bacterium]
MRGGERNRHLMAKTALTILLPMAAYAQQQPSEPGWPQPVQNDPSFGYAILNQNELRVGTPDAYRWEGEAWYGNDFNRLWMKSEGSVDTSNGTAGEAEVQGLYSRAVSAFFNLQGGVRYDFDPSARGWAALGFEGLAPLNWEIDAFAFVSGGGHLGARFEGYYDIYLTQRLVLQPQFELNAYSRPDRAARAGTGLTDADFGLRLRYELRRELAPYIGVTYETRYGATADMAHAAGIATNEVRFVAGIRAWL